jgi:hypothetical protein
MIRSVGHSSVFQRWHAILVYYFSRTASTEWSPNHRSKVIECYSGLVIRSCSIIDSVDVILVLFIPTSYTLLFG